MTHLDSVISVLLTKVVCPVVSFIIFVFLFCCKLHGLRWPCCSRYCVCDRQEVTPVVLEHSQTFFTFAVILGERTAGFCRSSSDGLLCSFTWILCFLSFFFTHHGNVHDFELLSRVSSVSVRLQWITKIRKRNKWRQSRWMKKCLVGTQKKIQLSVNT